MIANYNISCSNNPDNCFCLLFSQQTPRGVKFSFCALLERFHIFSLLLYHKNTCISIENMLKYIKIITILQKAKNFMKFLMVDKVVQKDSHTMNILHSHSHYEIYILTKGQRTYFFYNTLYTIKAPACIVIPPFVMHKTEGGGYERYNINVLPKYLDETEKGLLQSKAIIPISLPENDNKTVLRLLELLMEFQEQDERYNEYMSRACFNSILSIINKNAAAPQELPPTTPLPPLLLKMIDFFNHHYQEKITLDVLSNEFFVSKTTVIYNFKKHMNLSPMDYLLNVRLSKAKELLLSPQKISIEKMSELCGFSSANYFTECFKRKEGMPPTEFRKFIFQET